MKLSGEPIAHLASRLPPARTLTGSSKSVDVFPERGIEPFDMNGYELPISLDIFRGRYRTSFAQPAALTPNQPAEFTFGLPMVNYTVLPGHRLMVQVQSTLFDALRPQPADLRPEHLHRGTGCVSEGDATHSAQSATSACR